MDDVPATALAPSASGATPVTSPDSPPPEPTRRPLVPGGWRWLAALAVTAITVVGWQALSGPAADEQTGDATATPTRLDLTGQSAPAVRYPTFDGSTAGIADLRGTPVVLNFWGSWCPPCIEEMPAFESVHQTFGGRVRFVGLAVNDNEDSARRQAERTGVTYDLGFDHGGRIATAFGILNFPTTVLIDRDGTVAHTSGAGAIAADELTALIDTHLAP
jgi:peroxiredoxin